MLKRLGIIDHVYARPLFRGLAEPRDGPRFQLVRDIPAQLAIKLRQRRLDGAFLSPIDYGRDNSFYRIIPGCCAASRGESLTVGLFFNEHLHAIRTLAVDASSGSEVVLAHLVLKEKYDVTAQILPLDAPPEVSLKKADAVLLVGDACLAMKGRTNRIDLVDEWTDLTGLPFVHGLWVAREEALTEPEIGVIVNSGRGAAAAVSDEKDGDRREYLSGFLYEQKEDVLEGLSEYFRLAYYHGILEDIPDILFHDVGGRM